MDGIDFFLLTMNYILLLVIFMLLIIIFIRLSDIRMKYNDINYYVYKPLFPYEMPYNDNYKINMDYKKLIQNNMA